MPYGVTPIEDIIDQRRLPTRRGIKSFNPRTKIGGLSSNRSLNQPYYANGSSAVNSKCNCPECSGVNPSNLNSEESYYAEKYNAPPPLNLKEKSKNGNKSSYCDSSCSEVLKHVLSCEICNRYYQQDETVYVIIILILLVACALMAHKLFNN